MQRASWAAAMVALSMAVGPAAARAPLDIGDPSPESFKDIFKVIYGIDPDGGDVEETEAIPPYLEEAKCGGWSTNDGYRSIISEITGAPGRRGDALGDPLSGMALREEEFVFPDNVKGLATACSPDDDGQRQVWRPVEGGRPDEVTEVTVSYLTQEQQGNDDCTARAKVNDAYSDTLSSPLPDNNPPSREVRLESPGDYPLDRQNESNCITYCKLLNTLQYVDCSNVIDDVDISDPANPVTYKRCTGWGLKFLCSNTNVPGAMCAAPVRNNAENTWDHSCNGAGNSAERCDPNAQSTLTENAKSCSGEECRCGPTSGPGCADDLPYYSYYRKYDAITYNRNKIMEAPQDQNSGETQAACYWFYNEFDPKTRQTKPEDRQCLINIEVADRRETQAGKGEYGQNTDAPDPLAVRRPDGELWFEGLGGAFSLLREEEFDASYDKDLTRAIGAMERAAEAATPQLSATNPMAQSAYLRAFDETGERILTRWWQKQQAEAAKVFDGPVIRVLLPDDTQLGVDASDPLLSGTGVVWPAGNVRNNVLELQAGVAEDVLGEVFASIVQNRLLNLQEVSVPIVVPLASPTELRAKEQAWCAWYQQSENTDSCDGAPDNVRRLIESLRQYADRIEESRALRTQLAVYAANLIRRQREVSEPLQQWFNETLKGILEIADERSALKQAAGPAWQRASLLATAFSTNINRPWCMNQRYTIPIYSLLDPWLPSREEEGALAADGLPNLTVEPSTDIVLDLSSIRLMTGSFLVPVLRPIQLQLAIPDPPALREPDGLTQSLPDLPNITNVLQDFLRQAQNLPQVESALPPVPVLPESDPGFIARQTAAMTQIASLWEKLITAYGEFWASIGPLTEEEAERLDAIDPNSQEGRSNPAIMKRKMECTGQDSSPCKHVEMDLMERVTRITARPLVLLPQDMLSVGPERMSPVCLPENETCEIPNRESQSGSWLWDLRSPPASDAALEQLRTKAREDTLPSPLGTKPENELPPYKTSPATLPAGFDPGTEIDLSPPKNP